MYNTKTQYLPIVLLYKCMYIINDLGYYMCTGNSFMTDVHAMDCQPMVNSNINTHFINH